MSIHDLDPADWDDRDVRKAYALAHYSEALNYMAEAPPLGYICANCGETTDDAGRFRKGEDYEVCDAEGDIYECGTCGSHMCLPPPAETALASPDLFTV